jgi:uncharacterized protein (TIGR03382 family)
VWSATSDFLTYAQSSAGANLVNYGVVGGGSSTTPDDFAFTLTNLNSNGGGVPINATTRLPSAAFQSEGSFSGTANIPTPGAAGLLAAGGLMVLSRRRRA